MTLRGGGLPRGTRGGGQTGLDLTRFGGHLISPTMLGEEMFNDRIAAGGSEAGTAAV
jgi:hypothetical protein